MNEIPDQALVYAAGPIEEAAEDARDWYTEVPLPPGIALFCPWLAFRGDDYTSARTIERANRTMLMTADGVLANLRDRATAFGTIREIEFARLNNKPVVVVCPSPIMSLSAHDIYQEVDLVRGIERLAEVIKSRREAPDIHPLLMMLGLQRLEPDEDA